MQEHNSKVQHRLTHLYRWPNADGLLRRRYSEDCRYCSRNEEHKATVHVQAINVDVLADGWTTQDFRQEQTTDDYTGPILTAEEKFRRPYGQDICNVFRSAEELLGTMGFFNPKELTVGKSDGKSRAFCIPKILRFGFTIKLKESESYVDAISNYHFF